MGAFGPERVNQIHFMKCDTCKGTTHVIRVTRDYRALCDKCYDLEFQLICPAHNDAKLPTTHQFKAKCAWTDSMGGKAYRDSGYYSPLCMYYRTDCRGWCDFYGGDGWTLRTTHTKEG